MSDEDFAFPRRKARLDGGHQRSLDLVRVPSHGHDCLALQPLLLELARGQIAQRRVDPLADYKRRPGIGQLRWASPKSWYSDKSTSSSLIIRIRRSAKPFSSGLPTAAMLIGTPRPDSRSVYAVAAYCAPPGRSGGPRGGGPAHRPLQGRQGEPLVQAATQLPAPNAAGEHVHHTAR